MTESRRGAWLINLAKHLIGYPVTHPALMAVDNVQFAGKCGALLVALSSDIEPEVLSSRRIGAIARNCGIGTRETPLYLDALKVQGCVDFDAQRDNLEILAFTRHRVLETTSTLFLGSPCTAFEKWLPELLEYCLPRPRTESELKNYLADKLTESEIADMLRIVTELGILGIAKPENVSGEIIYFNGYQFGDKARSFGKAFGSLTLEKQQQLDQLLMEVAKQPAIPADSVTVPAEIVKFALGFGLVDESEVSSPVGIARFLTLPRFAPTSIAGNVSVLEDDVFHHAKQLLSAFKFGELKSTFDRGQIMSPLVLVNRLLESGQVGPCTAIGQDYGLLEADGVLQTIKATNKPGDQRFMKLRRKEPAELVRRVLQSNTDQFIAEQSSGKNLSFPTKYTGPEAHRAANLGNISPATIRRFMEDVRS
ncbi:MAG: hypothetical protein C0473_00485 [Cyanobacteria bacterium DS3.002]|nr:hypothetical protein [Cyanobacteria bacterium DS3.002]MBA4075121.1 hypothetical protein [Cyanobacteria bacterium PR.023]